MGALDAFYSTWSQARTTFGQGVPASGEQFDQGSSQLRQMQTKVQSAAPDDRWQGTASQAYAAKNAEHAAIYGKLAELDTRMAREVTRSAEVVSAGRQRLDQVHAWVTDAAASVPNNRSGETLKLAIANKGVSQIKEIIEKSNSEMSAIGQRVRGIGKEYDEIGGDKKDNASPSPLSDKLKFWESETVPGKAVRPFDGVLTDEEWQIARNSPTLLDEWDQARAQGWTFTSESGEGTYTDSRNKVINIDPDLAQNGPFQRVNAISHELGHALKNPPIDHSSKEAFVNSRLDGEGAATMNTMKIEREILAAGGADIIPAAPNDDKFEQIYDAYLQAGSTSEAYSSAIRQIGDVYGNLVPSTDPTTTYREYYGRDYK